MSLLDLQLIDHAMTALERKPRIVVIERNPLDFCDACGAEDKFGSFEITQQNGREIALCDRCR